jgi:hypothetical protein
MSVTVEEVVSNDEIVKVKRLERAVFFEQLVDKYGRLSLENVGAQEAFLIWLGTNLVRLTKSND